MTETATRPHFMRTRAETLTQRPLHSLLAAGHAPLRRTILIQLILPFLRYLIVVMRQHSRLSIWIALITFEGFGKIEAATVRIDLGPSQVLAGETNRFPFAALNGTPIGGSISVNILFGKNQFVRLFSATSPGFHALVILRTNGPGMLGFLRGTGYLIDARGNAIPGYRLTGSASGNDGTVSIGVFPLLMNGNGTPNDSLSRPLDFYGIRYDFTFPSSPLNVVIGGQFLLAGNGKQFGIGPNVPADIVPPDRGPPCLANISTRAVVQPGDNVVIGGFIIAGTQKKRVLLRAIGPSLPLAGKLMNPVLELHNNTGALIASNDNWGNASNRQEIVNSGAPPTHASESAIISSLAPGRYTAIVRGAANTTGIALIEGYDLDRTPDSRFVNISTRGRVLTGENVMIGGFIVLRAPQKVIIRAMGPSLALAGKLANPTLELHNAQGAILSANDNWRTTQQAEIMATGIPPANNLESAIVRTLPPGGYTAIVRGANGTTGQALVEIYALN